MENYEDKYLWLEEVLDKKNLAWASSENDRTAKALNNGADFDSLVKDASEILESKEKIPFATYIEDDFVYNLWKDDKNVQGLFRRAKISDYNKEITAWEIILDLDALSLKEGQKWVFHGCHTSPSKERALMFLSPGGSDADVMREFDLKKKDFVVNGFELPLAKGKATWITENELIVIRDMGSETVTSSGYAKEVRLWNRGEVVPNQKPIFEIPKEDMGIFFFEGDGENPVVLLSQKIDFYSGKTFLFKNGKIQQIDLPNKYEEIDATDKTLYVSVKENWKQYHLGDVVAYNYEDRSYELVYRPSNNSAVYSISITRDGLFMIIDIDVKSSLFFFSKKGGAWTAEKIEMPGNGSMDYLVSAKKSNDFFVGYDSFNMPLSYFYGVKNKVEKIVKKEKSFFHHEDIEVSQHFVKSLDGTRVPYFLVHKKGLKMNGVNPTILYGYGGFEISLKAHFSNILGKLWLDKGGVYVLSNIRGGGEYGPAWHQSALKENR
ncbi:MAG: hypothetical protein K2Q18_04150, partial [Bdellovibrionales bacterium]|nr:hypothetical protein [Bdellovibrionales bacterium]